MANVAARIIQLLVLLFIVSAHMLVEETTVSDCAVEEKKNNTSMEVNAQADSTVMRRTELDPTQMAIKIIFPTTHAVLGRASKEIFGASKEDEKCRESEMKRLHDINCAEEAGMCNGFDETGEDKEFPAAEASIAQPPKSCGDPAQKISESCSKYNDWKRIREVGNTNYQKVLTSQIFGHTDLPHLSDVLQGQLANCYFLSAIASLAYRDPEVIKGMFVRREEKEVQGIFSTKWWVNGYETVLEVNDQIPAAGKPFFSQINAKSNAWWPSILEKSWAKLWGSYKDTEMGFWSMAVSAITRAPTSTFFHTGMKNLAFLAQKRTHDSELWDLLLAASEKKLPMGALTLFGDSGLPGFHVYSVLIAFKDDKDRRLVKVRNPWGRNVYKGDAPQDEGFDQHKTGIFNMFFEEYVKAFLLTSIARVEAAYTTTSVKVPLYTKKAHYWGSALKDKPSTKTVKGVFELDVQSDTWFSVSIVWPSALLRCDLPRPSFKVEVKNGTHSFKENFFLYGQNSVQVEVPGGGGKYNVSYYVRFPMPGFVDEVFVNVYADSKVTARISQDSA